MATGLKAHTKARTMIGFRVEWVLCRTQAYNQQGKKSQAKGRQNRYPVPFLPGMSLKPARPV
jgi:hypothetical protein